MNYNSTKDYWKLVKELALLISSPDSNQTRTNKSTERKKWDFGTFTTNKKWDFGISSVVLHVICWCGVTRYLVWQRNQRWNYGCLWCDNTHSILSGVYAADVASWWPNPTNVWKTAFPPLRLMSSINCFTWLPLGSCDPRVHIMGVLVKGIIILLLYPPEATIAAAK